MNVLYLHTHDTGRYISPYGYAAPTPHLQALAEEGLLFRSAFCAAPVCSASRSALLTGMAPHSAGMLGLAHRGFCLAHPQRHLSHFLRGHGYETVLCGVQHEAADARTLGYGHILDDTRPGIGSVEKDERNTAQACAYLQSDHDRPFFLSLGFANTHRVYPRHPDSINPNYVMPPWPVEDTPANREDMADYLHSIQVVDRCVGRVMDTLRQSGLMERTLVLFTTDHGLPLPHMKCTLYDTGIGVSMLLRYPGMPAAGRVTDRLVSQIDLFPTLCDLLHLPGPDYLQGVSLLPVIERDQAVREQIYAEVTYHAAYEPMRCIRTDRHKLICRYDDHHRVVPANIDASPAKASLLDAGYLQTTVPREALYDLRLDPAERINLAQAPAHQAIYETLKRRLYAWMRDTDDPLLRHRHRVPAPDGARVNRLATLDPSDCDYE